MEKAKSKRIIGRASNPFADALKSVNNQARNYLQQGKRVYFRRDDMIELFQKFKGQCAVCGLILISMGRSPRTAHFVFKLPPKLGGKIHKDNLILVCPKHEKDLSHVGYELVDRVFGYNAFSDLIVQLVQATIEKDSQKIQYFKFCVDNAMSDFIGSLRYVATCKPNNIDISYDNDTSISEAVKDITDRLVHKLKEISVNKSYITLRSDD